MNKLRILTITACFLFLGCDNQQDKELALAEREYDQAQELIAEDNIDEIIAQENSAVDMQDVFEDENAFYADEDSAIEMIDEHLAINSLDYMGVYENEMVINNIPRRITIELEEDTYFITVSDIENNQIIEEHEGSYSWNAKGNGIILGNEPEGKNHYFVTEDALLLVSPTSNNPVTDATERWVKIQ